MYVPGVGPSPPKVSKCIHCFIQRMFHMDNLLTDSKTSQLWPLPGELMGGDVTLCT